VACTGDQLLTAVRFLIVQRRLADLREVAPEVDAATVEQQARTIRTSLGRIKTVKILEDHIRLHMSGNEKSSMPDAELAEDLIGLVRAYLKYFHWTA